LIHIQGDAGHRRYGSIGSAERVCTTTSGSTTWSRARDPAS